MLANLRSTLRRQRIGVSLGMLALFIALGSAVVVAQEGGGSGEVRACVLPGGSPREPNVRIVGANDSCPADATPRNWNIQGPTGPQGPQGPLPDIVTSEPPTLGEIEAGVGAALPASLTRFENHKDGGSNYKSVNSPPCPRRYSFFSGGHEVRTDNRDGYFHLFESGPVTGKGGVVHWHAAAAHDDGGGTWRLTAYVLCKKIPLRRDPR